MNISAFKSSIYMNVGVSVGMFSLYSILRKQPLNLKVYFGQRVSQGKTRNETLCFERFVPSASWILKAWEATEEDIFASGGIDAVVFLRIVTFSIRIFSIATILCIFLVLPLNYFGQGFQSTIDYNQMDLLTIGNVKEGSRSLWAHCFTLYIITGCACTLLYHEYKNVAKMRLEQVNRFPARPSNFTVLVRGIPWCAGESYNSSIGKFFGNYYQSSYIAHQIVYRSGAYQTIMEDAEMMYNLVTTAPSQPCCEPNAERCGVCGERSKSFKATSGESETETKTRKIEQELREKECEAALVFFKSRYDALVVSNTIQSQDPMFWVTELASEPKDVFWQNLCVPFNLLWIRRISVFIASIIFSVLFLLPTTFVQGLMAPDYLAKQFPSLEPYLPDENNNNNNNNDKQNDTNKERLVERLVPLIMGYLPSLVLTVFLIIVPPTMMLFSTLEGAVSRSTRKRSACVKVIIFIFWNVYFSNIISGSWIDRMGTFKVTSPRDMATLLAEKIPKQATFFMTYVMTSGWSGLGCELLQPVGLLGNWIFKCVLHKEEEFCRPVTFSYHTEVSRVLLFGLLGFTFCILAPLILPVLLVYFFFAFLVYRNQIMNVYFVKYQTDGSYWPLAHNATIFSLILTQVVAAVLFGMKKSNSASTFTIPLIILTALFNVFCNNRFLPVFKNRAAQVLIEMDRDDERSGRKQEVLEKLTSSYNQFELCGLEPPGKEEKPGKGSDESLKDLTIGSPPAEVVVKADSPTAEVVVKTPSPLPPPTPPPEMEPETNIVSIK